MRNFLNPNVKIGTAEISDLATILLNEKNAYTIPWSENSIEECFNGNYHIFVLRFDHEIIGHMIIQHVLDEIHLHNVCIIPAFQNHGLGLMWLEYLKNFAQEYCAKSVILEVRESNLRAIGIYLEFGFKQIGFRKDYYQTADGREHGLVMEWIV